VTRGLLPQRAGSPIPVGCGDATAVPHNPCTMQQDTEHCLANNSKSRDQWMCNNEFYYSRLNEFINCSVTVITHAKLTDIIASDQLNRFSYIHERCTMLLITLTTSAMNVTSPLAQPEKFSSGSKCGRVKRRLRIWAKTVWCIGLWQQWSRRALTPFPKKSEFALFEIVALGSQG